MTELAITELYAGDEDDLSLLHSVPRSADVNPPKLLVDELGRFWCWFDTTRQEIDGAVVEDVARYFLAEPAAIKLGAAQAVNNISEGC